jgi:Domain of unknown function (DUF5666)
MLKLTGSIALTLVSIASLASCGQTPIAGGTQVLSGTITSLSADRSSLTVAGKTLTRSASSAVRVNGKSAKASALSVGQKVKVNAAGSTVTDVDVEVELKGKIESIDATAGTITVAGKTVTVDANTRIDLAGDDDTATSTKHTIADLTVNDFVEVSGSSDASGNVLASKIEVKSATELNDDGEDNDTELKGTVSGFTAGTTTFMLKDVTVNCTSPCVLPTTLKNGDFVEAEGTLAGKVLTAKKVKLEDDGEDDHAPAGSTVSLEDDIKSLDTTAKTFKIEGYTVDYATATVTGTLANDAEVKVEGAVDSSDMKLVHATTVTVEKSGGHH